MYLSKIRLISFALSAAMALSPMAAFANEREMIGGADIELAAPGIDEVYTADFASLVKNNAETEYTASSAEAVTEEGTGLKKVIVDDYTSIYLSDTYGFKVSADGKVALAGDTSKNNNKNNGAYVNGAYVEFTAPSDGTVTFTGADMNYYIDGNYTSYGSSSQSLTAGQKLQLGTRKATTAVNSLSFEPKIKVDLPVASPYTPTKTTWTFDDSIPAEEETDSVPYITGQAGYSSLADGGEIKFPADKTGNGSLIFNMAAPIKNSDPRKNNVKITFDVTGHSKALGQQLFEYSVKNSEGFELIKLTAHPYDNSNTNLLTIGGKEIAKDDEIRNCFTFASGKSEVTSTVETAIDYYSRKITVTIKKDGAAAGIFTGDIPEDALQDVMEFVFTARRSKTAAERYISFDDFTIEEYTSTAEPATEPQIADGYTAETIGEMSARVKAPAEAANLPVLIYLCGSARFGADNYSQLYNAQYLFDAVGDKAILIAPQTETEWDTAKLKTFIEAAKTKYSAANVTVAGQGEGADAAYALTDAADKIVPIGGVDPSAVTAENAKVWAFADYADANIAKIRTAVSALQKAQKDVTYTEFPFEESNSTSEKAAEAAGLVDWITTDAAPQKTVDLVLFAGQSNMAGRGEYEKAAKVGAGHGFEYHSVTEPGVLTTVSEPFGKYENNTAVNDNGGDGNDRRTGDMVSSFMESYYSVSGVPIVGVQCSRGGTESKWWNTAEKLTEMAARYNEAKAYLESCGYTVNKQFMVWCQGCSDADSNRGIETYKSNTKAIFEGLKTSTGISDMFMIRIGHCKTSGAAAIDDVKDPRYKAINLAQKELCDETADMTAVASLYTDEYAALMRDQYHYHQEAYNSVGAVAGNNTAVTLYPDNAGAWTDYPEPNDAPDEPVIVEGVFEKTANTAEIDVSDMKTYGADTFRVYKSDKSYVDVKAANGKVANPTGTDEVTVVPVYRFNYTNAAMDGYVTATGTFSETAGYGLMEGQSYGTNADGSLPKGAAALHVVLPVGSYDMNILRKGGTRADVYNDGIQIINNSTAAEGGNNHRGSAYGLMYAPQVLVSDGSADITIGNTASGDKERIASVEIVKVPDKYKKPIIWIAGDSEAANYYPIDANGDDLDSSEFKITGFGQQLGKFLSDKYKIANWGQPSATVKTWYDECFDAVSCRMAEGDTIIVDFGINDAISSSNGISVDDMKGYMTRIFDAAKAKGVTPILVSPLWNGKYQHRSYFTYDKTTDTNSMTAFAQERGVKCIDLNKYSMLYKDRAIEETGDNDWVKNNYHVSDNLHQTQYTALLLASFIAAGMKSEGYETTDYAYIYTDTASLSSDYVRVPGNYKRVYSVAAAEAFMADGTITKPSDTPEPTDTPKPDDTPKPSDAPEYPITVSYDAQSKKLTLTATGNITNAVVIKASYDGDKMSDVKIYPAEFADNTAVIENIEISENDRIFVWDSTADMKPLAPVFTAAGAKAAEMMAWRKDYNHYYIDFSNYARPDKSGG